MFNLNDILQSAQGGQAINNIAQRFGLSPEQAQSAAQALIPALSAGLTKAAANPGTLGSVISAVNDSTHQASFNDPNVAQSPAATDKSNDTLSQILGSNHIIQQIVQRASAVTGIRPDILMQMLPVIATIVIGGLATSLNNQGLGGMLGQLQNAVQQGNLGSILGGGAATGGTTTANSGGGLMSILTNLLGGLFGGQSSGGAATAGNSSLGGALGSLTNMFQTGSLPANISQSGLQDEIGQILGGRK